MAEILDRPVAGTWRFGPAELQEPAGRLSVGGSERALDRSGLQLLRCLLQHAGEVVTKDELLETGWPGRVVGDNSLAKAVSRLRSALGSAAEVRAVHGYGYRLATPAVFLPATTEGAAGGACLPGVGDSLPGEAGWVLVQALGEGSSGRVFLARSPSLGERVVKLARDEAGLRTLRREAALARHLAGLPGGCPQVVPVLGGNLSAPPCWLELPWLAEGNLRQWLQARGGLQALDEAARLALCVAACEAVAAVHDRGLIHCDLKPDNLYPCQDADGPRMLLADLGCSEAPVAALATRLPTLGLRQAGMPPVGSLPYLAPEVAAGQPATQRSDVHALGVLVFQLMAGDLRLAPGPGWERHIADPLLRGDIALAAAADPAARRLDAAGLAERLRTLEARRAAARQSRARASRSRLQAWRYQRARRRWRASLALIVVLGAGLLALWMLYLEAGQRRLQAERATAQRGAMLAFLTDDILGQADPYAARQGLPAPGSLRAAMDRAAARADDRLQHDPLAAAAVHGMLGNLYFAQDAHDRAVVHLEKARSYARAAGGGDPAGLVQIETTLCDVHRIGGRLETAEEACGSALAQARRGDRPVRDLAVLKLGQLRSDQGRHGDSLALLRPLADRDAFAAVPRLQAELHWAIGLSHRALGDYPGARTHFDRLLAAAQAMGPDSSWLGWAYNSLGSVLVETGEYNRAEDYLRRAHAVFVRTQGPDQVEAQMPEGWRAEIRLRQGRWEEAAVLLRGIRQAWDGRLDEGHPLQQRARAGLALADAMAGRRGEAAAALSRGPADGGDSDGADRSSAGRLLRWARVALVLGEAGRAGELLDRFERHGRASLPERHPLLAEARCLRSVLGAAPGAVLAAGDCPAQPAPLPVQAGGGPQLAGVSPPAAGAVSCRPGVAAAQAGRGACR